jgi:hypothetical protein
MQILKSIIEKNTYFFISSMRVWENEGYGASISYFCHEPCSCSNMCVAAGISNLFLSLSLSLSHSV